MLKVSIIVPVYNAAPYLDRCIGSILAQDLSEYELLLVDDASSDDSVAICQKYEKQDSRIHLLYNQHGGAASARNKALTIARGEFIAFLDADDCYHPKYLSSLYQAAVYYEADISACRLVRGGDIDEFISQDVDSKVEIFKSELYLVDMYTNDWENKIAPVTKIYNKKLISHLFFPEGKCFEDAATIYKAIYYSQKIAYIDSPLYYYNVTPNSASSTQKGDELLDREEALRGHIEFYKTRNEHELALWAKQFYLEQLIVIWHKMRASDHPEYADLIKLNFKETYEKNHSIVSPALKEKAFAFLHPSLYDIRNMIKNEGIIKTGLGFLKRKLKKQDI